MISNQSTGVYIAYPTTKILKPTWRKRKTLVNNCHTNVGITKKSFHSRELEYHLTFGGEVEFRYVAEIPVHQLEAIERQYLAKLREQYLTVGNARKWFVTDDRENMLAILKSVFKTN